MHVLVLDKPLGELGNEGDVIHLEDDAIAESLISAGYAHEATEEDISGQDSQDSQDTGADEPAPEAVTAAVNGLRKRAEQAVTKAAEMAAKRIIDKSAKRPAPAVKVAAELKSKPFGSFGNYAKMVFAADVAGDYSARKKLAEYAQYKGQMNEGTAADGGNLVPVDYAKELFSKSWEQVNLLQMATPYPISGNIIKIPAVNESAASNGITAGWTAEAAAITDTKSVFGQVSLTLNRLSVLCNVTDELLEDNSYALETHLQKYVPQKIRFKLNDSIVNGGNGQANLIGSAATVSVGRQHQGRISFRDIGKMVSRFWSDSFNQACFFVSPTNRYELMRLAFADVNGTAPIYVNTGVPGGYPNLQYEPAGTLYGRPVYYLENMPALGTAGDILLADMSQVAAAYKEMKGDMSMHLFFDKHISSFRFSLRVASSPLWLQTWTRADGTTTSPFVVLDATGDTSYIGT